MTIDDWVKRGISRENAKKLVSNGEYWKGRFNLLEESQNRKGIECYAEIESQYRQAQRTIEGQITSWYQRFANNNEITMQEARRLLNTKELDEFKWEVEDYIRYGKENAINGAWVKQLENVSARYHISRLEALKIQTQNSLEVLFGNQLDSIDNTMHDVYKSGYYHTAFEIQKGLGIGWDFATLDDKTISKVINKPWAVDGKNFSKRIWGNCQKLVSELDKEVVQNIILGKDPQKAIDAIARKMKTSKSNAGKLVMTEEAFFSSAAQEDAFKELDVEKYEVVATLDKHTSEMCRELDGQVFMMKEYQAGVTAPPFHPWCRTTTVPYFDDDFGVPEERAARGEDGKTYYVPADMKYEDWEKSFVEGDKSGLQSIPDSATMNVDNWEGLDYTQSYTKQTAIDQLKGVYGIQFSDSRKYPMDGSLLSDCVGWLDSFSSQYPGFMQENPCKIPVIENKAPSKMKNAIGSYSYYGDGRVDSFSLNGAYHSDMNYFQEYVERCVQSKWYPANATTHKTFVHEYGHHVSNSMRRISANPDWQREFIAECIKDFKAAEPNYQYNTWVGMKEYVSGYAASSEAELFAESFAEYFGGENPREFAKIFGKKLDALLKGVK